jgi:hypothetical protein
LRDRLRRGGRSTTENALVRVQPPTRITVTAPERARPAKLNTALGGKLQGLITIVSTHSFARRVAGEKPSRLPASPDNEVFPHQAKGNLPLPDTDRERRGSRRAPGEVTCRERCGGFLTNDHRAAA